MMDKSTLTTGLVFLRDSGARDKETGRRLFMLVSVVAVPDDFPFQSEHQYMVYGTDTQVERILGKNDTVLHISNDVDIDLSEFAAGKSLGNLVTEAIWRI